VASHRVSGLAALDSKVSTTKAFVLSLLTRPAVFLPSLVIGAALLLIPIVQGQLRAKIAVANMTRETGFAVIAPVTVAPIWPTRVWGYEAGVQASDPMQLFEDGVPLGPGNTRHDLIRSVGRGAYSHWGRVIYFSSSDGSDPLTNGRQYDYRVRAALAGGWLAGALLLTFVGGLGLTRHEALRGHRVADLLARLIRPTEQERARALLSSLFCLCVVLACVAIVIDHWRSPSSAHLGLAGYLPVSDAFGYFRCALMIGDADWCGRRDVYPLTLHSILALSGDRAGLALLLQAAITGAAIGALGLAVARASGMLASAMAVAGAAAFCYEWSLGTFMTEALGAPAGFLSGALLISYCERRHRLLLAAGIVALSLALTARAGALFALPLVCLWGYACARPLGRILHWPSALLVLGAVMVGPALQVAGAWHIGAHVENVGGNYWASLYSLSTGARDWSSTYREFASLFKSAPETVAFQTIRDVAIQNIRAHPGVFIGALGLNMVGFQRHVFDFLPERYGCQQVAEFLLVLGTLRCAVRWRDPFSLLLAAVFAGELLSVPLIFDTGGQRGLAATVWVRPVLAGGGATLLVELLLGTSLAAHRCADATVAASLSRDRLALVCTALLILLPVAAILPDAASQQIPSAQKSVDCPEGQIASLAAIGRESMALTFEPPSEGSIFGPVTGPLLARPEGIEREAAQSQAWYTSRLGRLLAGNSIVYAFDRQPGTHGRPLALFWPGPTPIVEGGLYALCVGAMRTDHTLADTPLHEIVTISRLTE
jgi:hypothetical protein